MFRRTGYPSLLCFEQTVTRPRHACLIYEARVDGGDQICVRCLSNLQLHLLYLRFRQFIRLTDNKI